MSYTLYFHDRSSLTGFDFLDLGSSYAPMHTKLYVRTQVYSESDLRFSLSNFIWKLCFGEMVYC